MKTYNKLVRDKIPQIIETSGKSCDVKVLNEEEYEAALKKKMQEELNEFLEAKDKNEQIHELADLLEVIYSFAHNQGTTIEELENIRKNKQDGRGGFGEKIMLLTVQ
ncbi:nucleoside triphosphate pyrophosphohydrolase [Paenibacillus illinoisensis]|uniref:nucleoside triphosphate pyrophosphohydrolase n=1 Tax=Paenibacillus illinoisensis TaxID=59845 RepID=UPI003D9649A8